MKAKEWTPEWPFLCPATSIKYFILWEKALRPSRGHCQSPSTDPAYSKNSLGKVGESTLQEKQLQRKRNDSNFQNHKHLSAKVISTNQTWQIEHIIERLFSIEKQLSLSSYLIKSTAFVDKSQREREEKWKSTTVLLTVGNTDQFLKDLGNWFTWEHMLHKYLLLSREG